MRAFFKELFSSRDTEAIVFTLIIVLLIPLLVAMSFAFNPATKSKQPATVVEAKSKTSENVSIDTIPKQPRVGDKVSQSKLASVIRDGTVWREAKDGMWVRIK